MWIKVCGIRDRETARRLGEIEIDAIGLNFFSGSPRFVELDEAVEISRILPKRIDRVGVFVNHPIETVESIATRCQLDILQLHGDESASYLAELRQRLPKVRLIRAWRMAEDGLKEFKSFLDECHERHFVLHGCLIDAHVTGVYGGSGKTVSWDRLVDEYQQTDWPPLILAGGLTPANVGVAISVTRPWGVDVASGVESSPGVKDFDRIRDFVANARAAVTS